MDDEMIQEHILPHKTAGEPWNKPEFHPLSYHFILFHQKVVTIRNSEVFELNFLWWKGHRNFSLRGLRSRNTSRRPDWRSGTVEPGAARWGWLPWAEDTLSCFSSRASIWFYTSWWNLQFFDVWWSLTPSHFWWLGHGEIAVILWVRLACCEKKPSRNWLVSPSFLGFFKTESWKLIFLVVTIWSVLVQRFKLHFCLVKISCLKVKYDPMLGLLKRKNLCR